MTILAWACLLFVAYTYFGYAFLLRLLPARRANAAAAGGPAAVPSISVIIAACNEEANIGAKLNDVASLEYPAGLVEVLVGSDGSTDATDDIVRTHSIGARLFHFDRIGKTAVLNRLVAEASGDILVFMDARQTVTKDALVRFAQRLSDPHIAAVGGELALVDENGVETSAGVGVYWKYEKWLRKRESDLGMLSGLSGALYAMRRKLYCPPPDDAILDDVMIPLAAARRGYALVVDDGIRMFDRVAGEDREFRRKVRTLIGNFQMFAAIAARPRPFPARLLFSVLSHKVFRAVTPVALVGLLAGSLWMPRGPARVAFLTGQGLVYTLGIASLLAGGRIRNRAASVCSTFCVLNAAAAVALVRYVTGRYRTAWK